MARYLGTRGKQILSVTICDRCRLKVRYVDASWDRNAPGMRVCDKCNDGLDRWKLPPRQVEKLVPDYPRIEEPLTIQGPVVAFSYAPVGPDLAKVFTDLSTGGIETWAWDFGDGETSTLQNPTHVYAAYGSYTVTLTVTSPAGSSTTSQVVAISLPLVASFTTNLPLTGTDSPSVVFTDTTSGGPTEWLWDFGDGDTSALQNPGHTYLAAGTYTVTLTASRGAESSSASKTVSVQYTPGAVVTLDAETYGVGGAGDVVKYSGGGLPTPLAPADTYSGVTFSALDVVPYSLSGFLAGAPELNGLDPQPNDGFFCNGFSGDDSSIYIPIGLKIVSVTWDYSYAASPAVTFYGPIDSKAYVYVNGRWEDNWERETINNFYATTGYLTRIRFLYSGDKSGSYFGWDNIVLTGESVWTVTEI